MKRSKTRPVPALWTVFDTNAVYTGSASYLLRREVSELITDNSEHVDLKVRWLLPEIVRHERHYQMLKQALALLPSIQKLENLLGHNLNITPEILDARVREAIERQTSKLQVEIAALDPTLPDWTRLSLDAAYRKPPFDSGDTEKGFRDALALETFMQLVSQAPVDVKTCRLAFVTGDIRLTEAVKMRTQGISNIRVLSSIEELKSLINTLVSEVDEAFVNEIVGQAEKLFYVSKEESTLYYTQKIARTIRDRVRGDVSDLPHTADTFEFVVKSIGAPQFVKKDRQRIHLSSRISVNLEAKKSFSVPITPNLTAYTTKNPALITAGSFGPLTGTMQPLADFSSLQVKASDYLVYSSELLSNWGKAQTVGTGVATYEAHWSVVVSTTKKLTRAQVDSIEFVQAAWEQ